MIEVVILLVGFVLVVCAAAYIEGYVTERHQICRLPEACYVGQKWYCWCGKRYETLKVMGSPGSDPEHTYRLVWRQKP